MSETPRRVKHVAGTRLGRTLWFWMRSIAIRYPKLYFTYYRLRGKNAHIMVNEATDIVMEGFGGSGNTFAIRALQSCQPNALRVAHHMHTPAQIIRGLELNKPVMVFVRDPIGAATSGISRHTVQYDEATLHQALKHVLKSYCLFHETVLPYKDQYVIAPFEETISNFGAITARVNAKFGTNFVSFEHTDENVAAIQSKQKTAKPGTKRLNDKDKIKQILLSPNMAPYLKDAQRLREAMLSD